MLRQNTVLPYFALILANVGMLSVSSGKTIIDVNATAGAVPYFDDEQLVYIARGIATVRSQAVFINPGFKYAASVYKGGSGSSFLVRPFPDQTFLDPPSPMVSQSQQYQYLGIAVLALHLVLGAGACYRWRRNRRRRIRLELPINMSSTSLHDEWIPSIRDQWASLHDDDVALSQVQQSLRTKHRNRRHSSVWMMSAEEMKSYEEIFRAWDIQKSGFLGYEFAMEAFRISGLAQEDLVRIWNLADMECWGKLNVGEFKIAMALIYRKLQGHGIPRRIPHELLSGMSSQYPSPSRECLNIPAASVDYLLDLNSSPPGYQSHWLSPAKCPAYSDIPPAPAPLYEQAPRDIEPCLISPVTPEDVRLAAQQRFAARKAALGMTDLCIEP